MELTQRLVEKSVQVKRMTASVRIDVESWIETQVESITWIFCRIFNKILKQYLKQSCMLWVPYYNTCMQFQEFCFHKFIKSFLSIQLKIFTIDSQRPRSTVSFSINGRKMCQIILSGKSMNQYILRWWH